MFNSDAKGFFSKVFGVLAFFLIFAVFSVGIQPVVLIVPFSIALLWLTYACVDCAYRNESFSKYAALRLYSGLGLAPLLAFVCTLAAADKGSQLSPVASVAVSCVPFVICGAAYVVVYSWPIKKKSLEVHGQRVEVIGDDFGKRSSLLFAGVTTVLSSVLYSVFRLHGSPVLVLVLFFVALSLFFVFHCRVDIASLKALKIREAREGCHYTFMNIEEIREKRAASLLGRLFSSKTV